MVDYPYFELVVGLDSNLDVMSLINMLTDTVAGAEVLDIVMCRLLCVYIIQLSYMCKTADKLGKELIHISIFIIFHITSR